MRILYIITGLDYGGAERLLLDTCVQLKELGHEVLVIYLKSEGKMIRGDYSYNFQVRKVDIKQNNPINVIKKIMEEIRSFNPDVVHTHLAHADFFGRIAALLCRTKKIFSTLHNTDTWRRSKKLHYRIYNYIDKYILNHFKQSRCIAISNAVKDYHVEYCKFNAEKVFVVKNAVNINLIREKGSEPMNECFKDSDDDLLLVNVGRLVEQKGQIYLLEALNELVNKRKIKKLKCMIIGEGEERNRLEEYIKQNNLQQNVKLLGLQPNPYKYIKISDVFIMPSKYEGFGIVVLEAYALYKPVISSYVDGLKEIVIDNQTGFFVKPGSYVNLADKIQLLYNNRDLIQKYSKNSQELLSQYTIERYTNNLLKYYKL